jgi:sugar phosphate isomerase/epimerase
MTVNRRKFIKSSTVALAGTLLLSDEIFANKKKMSTITGLQLYSVRSDMQKAPLDTLKQLSAMGYRHVEHANYVNRKFYGYSAAEFKKILEDLNLKMPSGHTVLSDKEWDESKKEFSDKWKQTIEDAATVGQKYVISPWMDERLRQDYDGLLHFLDVFNRCGELCKQSGLKFGYHNHDFEFKYSLNGQKVYDIILEKTDPALYCSKLTSAICMVPAAVHLKF